MYFQFKAAKLVEPKRMVLKVQALGTKGDLCLL